MKILHLSDLHFGYRSEGPALQSTHRFVTSVGKADSSALAAILKRDPNALAVDLVVVSGDLGWSGSSKDYESALLFLQQIAAYVDKRRIVLAPGNHDVRLESELEMDARQNDYIELLQSFYGDVLTELYPALSGTNSLSPRERLIGIHAGTDEFLAVSVNSSALQSTGSTPIAVGPSVMGYVEEALNNVRISDSMLRVFILHHHLLPFVEGSWNVVADTAIVAERPDPTMVANSARLQEWLARNDFGLVLHGHKHLSHGREDRLYREAQNGGSRRLVIVGCGSSGVTSDQREFGEPLSYNIIESYKTVAREWSIRVSVRRIDERITPISAQPWFDYAATAGWSARPAKVLFEADSMVNCHSEIRSFTPVNSPVRNFLSIVHDSSYKHPPTINDLAREPDLVEKSFRALHPEYHRVHGWSDVERQVEVVDEPLRLEHGTRMFRRIGDGASPIDTAIGRLGTRPTWAYAGLYEPDTDTSSVPPTLPGLMGIQFVPDMDSRILHAIATLRHIELSFWWIVNMYEMRKLLEYACQKTDVELLPGSVTIFAAIAEWKRNPDAVLIAELDEIDWAEALRLGIGVCSGDSEMITRFKMLLAEKARLLNPYMLETRGLSRVVEGFRAAMEATGTASEILIDVLERIAETRQKLVIAARVTGSARGDLVRASAAQLAAVCNSFF